MRKRKVTLVAAGTPFGALHAASRRPLQPRERLRGVWTLAGGNTHTLEETLNVGASRNSLRCQPPRFSLYYRVDSTNECHPAFLSAPQVVVSLSAALVALSCPEPDIFQCVRVFRAP